MFVHGGPGGACDPSFARFFNPARYRIILFDQRGCGKSTPSAAAYDATPALSENTVDDLIGDMQKLRAALKIEGKMHVFGGSWGSTLSLAYAIKHPEAVKTLILRGIFLCRRQDLDFFYQGNAATYHENPHYGAVGTYMFYPEAWRQFVEMIPVEKRGDMVKAYAELFAMVPKNETERASQIEAAKAWSIWEGCTSYRRMDMSDIGKFADAEFALAFAKIENHYFMNGAFLGGSGAANRMNNYLLNNIGAVKNIPVHIVHGRYDVVCPLFQAEELVAALKASGAENIDYRVTDAGHSMMDRENYLALADIMDGLK